AGKDPRFSGFYWASTNGDLQISTNQTNTLVNVGDRPYFQEAIKSEKTSISEPHFGRVTGRYIVSIATPIVNHEEIQGVLIASLRIDEIETAIQNLLKDEMIIVYDGNGKQLIKAGSIPKQDSVKSSMNVSQVPWTISAFVASDDELIFLKNFFVSLAVILTI